MTAPWRTADPAPKRVQLLAHSAALRTALRRALAATPYSLAAEAGASEPAPAPAQMRADVLVLELDGARGLMLLERIARAEPGVPVIAVLAEGADGQVRRAEALERGAAAVVSRPAADEPLALKGVADQVVGAISRFEAARRIGRPFQPPRPRPGRCAPQVLVVASSTGGPQALMKLFAQLPPHAVGVPVLVVQHMPAAFTPILAEHLSRATPWRAAEARADEPLVPGEIRIAPGGHHLLVAGSAAARRLKLTETAPVNFCRPSADVLFVSAAETFGRGVLAVILTGMGSDGCEGAKIISAAGGTVIAQDRATSVVWGMPGAAYQAGVVDRLAPLEGIAPLVKSALAGALQ